MDQKYRTLTRVGFGISSVTLGGLIGLSLEAPAVLAEETAATTPVVSEFVSTKTDATEMASVVLPEQEEAEEPEVPTAALYVASEAEEVAPAAEETEATEEEITDEVVDVEETDKEFFESKQPIFDEHFGEASFTVDETIETNDQGYTVNIVKDGEKLNLSVVGKDADGLFYGANDILNKIEYGQITEESRVESPEMPIRGVIEGFYGKPWSDEARKDMFEFMGKHGMNTYIYSPKNDPYLRDKWRDLYPEEEQEKLKSLIDSARKNHVDFVYVLSPGKDIEYTSDEDYQITVQKFDQLRALGVTQFYIALDDLWDVPLKGKDAEKYGKNITYKINRKYAQAQTEYLNRLQEEYIQEHNLPDLWFVPTDYAGTSESPYRTGMTKYLNKDIRIQWTGMGVFATEITPEQIEAAKKSYGSDHVFLWDNYPVNDQASNRLFMRPIFGRAAELGGLTDGFTANPMVEPYASWPGIKSYADYTWAPTTYDPIQSLNETIIEIAGQDVELQKSVAAFVDLNLSWQPYDKFYDEVDFEEEDWRAPVLSAFVNAYKTVLQNPDEAQYQESATNLREHLELIAKLPETLQNIKVKGFYDDSKAWIDAASAYAKNNLVAMDLIDFARHYQGDANDKVSNSTIEKFEEFFSEAMKQVQKENPDGTSYNMTPAVGDGVFQVLYELGHAVISELTEEQIDFSEDTEDQGIPDEDNNNETPTPEPTVEQNAEWADDIFSDEIVEEKLDEQIEGSEVKAEWIDRLTAHVEEAKKDNNVAQTETETGESAKSESVKATEAISQLPQTGVATAGLSLGLLMTAAGSAFALKRKK